jgi:hypothetical protein
MRGGDLGNTPVPRIIIVWENAIGYLPDDKREEWRRLAREGKWNAVARLFELDQIMLRKISDLTFRFDISVDVVTYCGPAAFAHALERLFERENVPVRIVRSTTPERMARRTSYEPDIRAIYDGNAEHAMVYGPKGVYLADYRQLGG